MKDIFNYVITTVTKEEIKELLDLLPIENKKGWLYNLKNENNLSYNRVTIYNDYQMVHESYRLDVETVTYAQFIEKTELKINLISKLNDLINKINKL